MRALGKEGMLFTCTAGGDRLHIHNAPIHVSYSSFWTINREISKSWCAPKCCGLLFFWCLCRIANKVTVNTPSLKSFENIDWIRIYIWISVKVLVGSLAYDLSD